MRHRLGLLILIVVVLAGCAAQGGGTPPQSQIPWDPSLITKNRQAEAARWAKDMERRAFVDTYMVVLCEADGKWARMNTEWKMAQADEWTKLWTFQPIPNAAPSGSAIDYSKLVDVLVGIVGKAADIALIVKPKPLLPPGLPPC